MNSIKFVASAALVISGVLGLMNGAPASGPDSIDGLSLGGIIGGQVAGGGLTLVYKQCWPGNESCTSWMQRGSYCNKNTRSCGPCPYTQQTCPSSGCNNEKYVKFCTTSNEPSSCDPNATILDCGTAGQGSCTITATDSGVTCAPGKTTHLCIGAACVPVPNATMPCAAFSCG